MGRGPGFLAAGQAKRRPFSPSISATLGQNMGSPAAPRMSAPKVIFPQGGNVPADGGTAHFFRVMAGGSFATHRNTYQICNTPTTIRRQHIANSDGVSKPQQRCRTRSMAQLIEQRLRRDEIVGRMPLGEPGVYRGEQRQRVFPPCLNLPKPRETGRGAQFA